MTGNGTDLYRREAVNCFPNIYKDGIDDGVNRLFGLGTESERTAPTARVAESDMFASVPRESFVMILLGMARARKQLRFGLVTPEFQPGWG